MKKLSGWWALALFGPPVAAVGLYFALRKKPGTGQAGLVAGIQQTPAGFQGGQLGTGGNGTFPAPKPQAPAPTKPAPQADPGTALAIAGVTAGLNNASDIIDSVSGLFG